MDKNTFLEELKKSLRVLREEELQDIIAEYEQHIDLKVQNGLTVEQAIADFGNVKELAAEILEAYHVRAEFSLAEEWDSDKQNSTIEIDDSVETEPIHEKKKISVSELWNIIGAYFSKIRTFILTICCWCGTQITRPFRWMKIKWSSRVKTEKTKDKKKPFKTDWFIKSVKGMGNILRNIWKWMIGAALWCLRVCWNCCVIGTSFFIGILGLMCLFAAGVFVVLLLQGYPLIGLTIGSVGMVLCFFSGAAFVWTLMWYRQKEAELQAERAITEDKVMNHVEINVLSEEEGQHA